MFANRDFSVNLYKIKILLAKNLLLKPYKLKSNYGKIKMLPVLIFSTNALIYIFQHSKNETARTVVINFVAPKHQRCSKQ